MKRQAETPIAGVVLAGGQSRRMGRDKSALPWHEPGGERLTWLAHAVRRLYAYCDLVVVSGHTDQAVASDVVILPDDTELSPGPLAGIATVLASLPGQYCLFLPVDMVRVTPDAISHTARHARPHAAHQKSLFPLCLHSDPSTRDLLMSLIQSDTSEKRSVRALLQALGADVNWLVDTAPDQLINANRPEDLSRFDLPVPWDTNYDRKIEENGHD